MLSIKRLAGCSMMQPLAAPAISDALRCRRAWACVAPSERLSIGEGAQLPEFLNRYRHCGPEASSNEVGGAAPACQLLSMKLEQVVAGRILLAVEVLLLAVQGAAAQGSARTIASQPPCHP